MSESLHDIAMKLGLLNDVGSFKQGEKLMKDFADAALAQQRRVKEAATDLSGTDKFLSDPAKNILKKSQMEQMKQESLFALDDKLANGTLSRGEYNKALQETVNRWTEITHAQQANIVILQHQQALQSINTERIEDEIQRQRQSLELKQDLNSRTQEQITSQNALTKLVDVYTRKVEESLSVEEKLYNIELKRIQAFEQLEEHIRKVNAPVQIYAKALNTINTEHNKERANIDGTNVKLAEEEALRKRTTALLGTYSNMADRVSEDIETLTLALQKNIITQEQFDSATSVANQRLIAVRGSSGNLVYAIGEMGRGLEDFITVMSITGFTTQGFGMAMRGASNNISQATMLMTGGSGALIGSAMGIGAIAIGQLIPYLFKTSKAVDEVTLAFERNSKAIDYAASAMSRAIDAKFKLEDISRATSSGEARNIFTETNPRAIEKTRADLARLSQERIATEIKNANSILGEDKFKSLNESVGLLKQGGFDEASVRIREGMITLRSALATGNADLINIAVKDLELLRKIYHEAFEVTGADRIGGDLLSTNLMGGMLEGRSDLEKTISKTITDKEKINDLQKDITEVTNKELVAKQQIADLEKQSIAAKEKYFQLLEKEEVIKDHNATRDAKILEQESQFRLHKQLDKDIRGNISEDSYLKDLSIRYRDMMSVDWMTEGSKEALDNAFRNDLFSREDELERSLFQQQPDLAVGTSTISEAMTNANKQMMNAENDDKFTQQLNELKAIKKALENNLFPVERIQ